MKIRSLFFIVLCFVMMGGAFAKTKKKPAKKVDITLLEAYSQRTVPGVRRATPPPTAFHFIIIWEGLQYPEYFYWRADTGLAPCIIARARKVVNKPRFNLAGTSDYYTEAVKKDAIKKGDTLDIIMMKGIKMRRADSLQVADDIKNTLFFKTGGNEWRSFHIDSVVKKRDILMP